MFFAVDENGVRTYIDDADANRKYFSLHVMRS